MPSDSTTSNSALAVNKSANAGGNNANNGVMQSCIRFVDRLINIKDRKGGEFLSEAERMRRRVYHERQLKELCALHALNNLFQDGTAYTKSALDEICHSLSPDHLVNPHKSVLGLGNYDVNVLMAALQSKGYEAVWFDKRRDISSLHLERIIGFILNVPSELRFAFLQFPLSKKHWIAVRQVDGVYYNLDSKLDSPAIIGRDSDLLKFLHDQVRCKDRELFIVVTQDVARNKACYRDQVGLMTSSRPPLVSVLSGGQIAPPSGHVMGSGAVSGGVRVDVPPETQQTQHQAGVRLSSSAKKNDL